MYVFLHITCWKKIEDRGWIFMILNGTVAGSYYKMSASLQFSQSLTPFYLVHVEPSFFKSGPEYTYLCYTNTILVTILFYTTLHYTTTGLS